METVTQTNKFGRTVFKGRWGFHAADYSTYLKLKALYKNYWKSLRLRAALNRWERKLPKNRKGAQPQYDAIHEAIIESNIVQEFQNIRIPVADADMVFPRKMTDEQINDLLTRWTVFQEKKTDLAA